MRILLLSDSNSPHTLRWAKSIRKYDNSVAIFSIHKPDPWLYEDTPDILLSSIDAPRELQTKGETNISKLIYLRAIKKVKQVIKEFKPDIVHSHYASSYGFIGAITGFHPYIISLWGSDVFNFPNKSIIHKQVFKFSLSKADKILSTSPVMKEEVKKYSRKEITIIPFGIDLERFYQKKVNSLFKPDDIVIGTIKTLEIKYGVEYLIRAFKLVKENFPDKSLKLLIVGGGTQREYLEKVVKDLALESDTLFAGFINHNDIQDYYNMLDIYVAVSLEESFGVAILEASACGKPVVVSDVGGLPEVVENNMTGYIVEKKNIQETANALIKLITNKNLREEMGKAGRQRVMKYFNWNENISQMINIYKQLL